jgi:SAM-dependent methyltransferase
MAVDAPHFEALFEHDDDPWRFRSRWYEVRKRALTLACLPSPRYARAYEPGCANGELSAALAARCDRLLVSDIAARAVAAARARTADLPQVQVMQARVPEEWPAGPFDLIVVSELAYYLSRAALDATLEKLRASLADGGTLLACHWRPPIEGCELDGDAVHERIGSRLGLPHLMHVLDADLRIDVWCGDARSVAGREGLRGGA